MLKTRHETIFKTYSLGVSHKPIVTAWTLTISTEACTGWRTLRKMIDTYCTHVLKWLAAGENRDVSGG